MKNFKNDFDKYSIKHKKINSNTLDDYKKTISNNYISPTIIEERSMNITGLDIFSRLMMDRIIFLGTTIDEDVSNIIQAQMLYLESVEPNKDINIYINSPGGQVYDGFAIYDIMNIIKCDTSTTVTGMAASMAAILLSAGTKGKRFGLKHSRIMIHQPMGGTWGQASDIDIATKEVNKVKKDLYEILVKHTGQPYKTIEKDADRDYWMSSDEACKYHLIDEIIKTK